MDKENVFDLVEIASRYFDELGGAFGDLFKAMQPETRKFMEFYFELDPAIAKKNRHRRKYERMYARGGKKRG